MPSPGGGRTGGNQGVTACGREVEKRKCLKPMKDRRDRQWLYIFVPAILPQSKDSREKVLAP